MLGKFWDHFWYLSLLHFAHNTKNGSSNDRTRLFCNVMHLHTENCFHFIFLCAFCASIATLLSVVHLALKRWKRNFSRCLFFHIVSQCLKITHYCLIWIFNFPSLFVLLFAQNFKVLTHFLSYFSGKNQVTELIWLQKLSGKWDIFWWFSNNVPQSKGKRGQGE